MGIAWRDYDLVRRQLAEVRNTIKDMVTAPSWCPFENTLNQTNCESPIRVGLSVVVRVAVYVRRSDT
jgi:hypothetical protein